MFHTQQPRECPLLEGRIMMLPNRAEVESRITTTLPNTTGIFNHPVVILSKEVCRGKVAVFIVTSFDDTPIENRHPDPVRRQSYLPIRPAKHPDTRYDLIPAHGKTMKKNSYVNMKEVHEIPFEALRPCWRDGDLHLETASYQILTSELWKRNIGELAVRLKGHGIFERVAQSAYNEVPVPVPIRHTDQGFTQGLGRGTSSTRTPSSPLSAYYGTFDQIPTAPRPVSYAQALTGANAARGYDYPSRVYQSQQSVPVRHNNMTLQQNYYRTEQQHHDEPNHETSGLGWLVLIAGICFVGAAWYWLAN